MLPSQDEFDPRSGVVVREVQEVFRRYAPVLGIHLRREGEDSPMVIRSTSEHPFYVSDEKYVGKWVAAGELQAGQWVLCDDGRWARVEEVSDSGEWEVVYNMRAAEGHTYFVGEAGRGYAVWVHNDSGCVDIALGVGSPVDYLTPFANKHSAKSYTKWKPEDFGLPAGDNGFNPNGTRLQFVSAFRVAVENSKLILVNLQAIEMYDVYRRYNLFGGGQQKNNITSYEIFELLKYHTKRRTSERFYQNNSTDDYVGYSQFKQSVLDMLEPHCREALTQVPSGEDWKQHREKVEYYPLFYRWAIEDDE